MIFVFKRVNRLDPNFSGVFQLFSLSSSQRKTFGCQKTRKWSFAISHCKFSEKLLRFNQYALINNASNSRSVEGRHKTRTGKKTKYMHNERCNWASRRNTLELWAFQWLDTKKLETESQLHHEKNLEKVKYYPSGQNFLESLPAWGKHAAGEQRLPKPFAKFQWAWKRIELFDWQKIDRLIFKTYIFIKLVEEFFGKVCFFLSFRGPKTSP